MSELRAAAVGAIRRNLVVWILALLALFGSGAGAGYTCAQARQETQR